MYLYLYLRIGICICICEYVFVFMMRVMIQWQASRCIGSSDCNTASWSRSSAFTLPNTFIQRYFYICICICISLTFIQRYFLFSPFVFVLNSPNIFCIRVHCSYSSPGNVFSSSNISFSSFDISCICVLYFSFPNCIAIVFQWET